MLGVFATILVLLGFVPSYAVAATCGEGFTWSYNSQGQSPCDIAAALRGVCIRGRVIPLPQLPPGYSYIGPGVGNTDECSCSSVFYSVLSACALCQSREFLSWSGYSTNCTTVYVQVFPDTIPQGLRVPHYAYLDVSIKNTFDPTAAQTAGGVESAGFPSPSIISTPGGSHPISPSSTIRSSGGSRTSSGGNLNISQTSLARSSSKILGAGSMAGGVVGGLLFIGVGAGVVFW